jgi:pyruvate dehydrogenase E2 component (dihydrolipoamide acetyltransferase)
MPKLGETVTTGTVTRWLLSVGDPVDFDDPLLEVATDKVDSEIPSPYSGVVLEIMVPEGETVEVGAELARIGAPGEADGPASGPASGRAAPGGGQASAGGAAGGSVTASAPPVRPPVLPPSALPPVAPPAAQAGNGGRALLSPIVRQLAARNGIDLATVRGSGATGRITREDVEAAIARASAPAPPAPAPPAVTPAAAAPAAVALGPRDEAQPLSRMRLAIAERMVESLRIAPHVWTSVEVDLQAVEEVRRRHKERFRREEGTSLTYLAFTARAVCDALRAFPVVNSSLDMQARTRVLHHYVNLGIAVDLSEQGLVAPVIRDADGLNLRGLARAIRAVADKANSGTFTSDDLAGSTFTITNPGPAGDYASAPIINQPNSAILSTNMVSRRPTAVGDAVAVHYMTILGFSYDHRAFDGVTASRFLACVRDTLQDRDWEAELGQTP